MRVFENPNDPKNNEIVLILEKMEARELLKVYDYYVEAHPRFKKAKETSKFLKDNLAVF